jgi:hypothetical protein
MDVRSRRRRAGAALVALAAVAAATLPLIDARGTTAAASIWGTFAHIATNDLSSAADKQVVADRYDAIALRGNLTAALLSDLHQRRAGIVLLAYEKAAGLNASEVTAISATNPEWIARDAAGNVIHPQNAPDTTLADLTNPGFRAWQANKIAGEVGLGADGAFIDTLGAYFPPDFYTGRPVVNGYAVTDAAWRDGSVDLLHRVKAATGRTVIANGFGLGTGAAYYVAAVDADQLIAAADGVQIEGFTRTGNAPADQYITAAKWDQDLAFLELLGARGKLALAYTKVKVAATAAQLASLRDYGLGSFLLAFAPGRSYFGFDDGNPIPAVASDTPWARGLGSPTAARVRSATDEWARAFQGGGLRVKVATAPVVTASTTSTVTFSGAGSERSSYLLTVGAGRVTATVTFAGGGYKTLIVFLGQAIAAGPLTGASPVVIDTTLAAGTYTFAVQGPSAAPFTLRVDYPAPGTGGATTTTATPPLTTTTTRPPTTTTTRASTTTTSSSSWQTATFSGTGATRSSYPLTVGSGPLTATVTFGGGGYKTLMILRDGSLVAGPLTGTTPVVIKTTLAGGMYTFAAQGPSDAPFTLRVDYPAPA